MDMQQTPQERIAAADNLAIYSELERWQLVEYDEDGAGQVVVEAVPGQPINCTEGFAVTHHLPRSGSLPLELVQQVVLGWSADDEAWHLGLLLARDLADVRGSRWCALARWPDHDTTVFADMAREAGRSLAQTIHKPFNVVPPRGPVVRQPPPEPLPALPVEISGWSLRQLDANQLEFTRTGRWVRAKVMRLVWYSFWIVIYLVLSIATLRTDLALPNAGTMLPNPELLPYLGLAAAVVLAGMVLFILRDLLFLSNRLVIDGAQQRVLIMRGKRPRQIIHTSDIQAVYASHVVNRRRKRRKIYHSELNLLLASGKFRRLLQDSSEEEVAQAGDPAPNGSPNDELRPLTGGTARTTLQVMALHISKTLGDLPCWYDQRLR
ncbi:MAG: hypothetical protein ACOCZH_03460 [Phototrophicaceae bacterium]